ncbi:unnamed protein product [Schistosoma mattheei]|uniref:Uncharacterized protein n=1 Tax=Schistosoma mattheei TaxID=31246 RepID=A0A183Q788_9TREM|nr:unnamed protein product [Schistosoma mattheei]
MLSKEARSALVRWESRGSRIKEASFNTNKNGITMNAFQLYAPIDDSNDDDKDQFYDKLHSIIAKCSRRNLIILMRDLNAKVGIDNTRYEDIVRRHGLTGRQKRNWRKICESVCIQPICHSWHNISTQLYTQSYMDLTAPHHREPDRSYSHQ